VSDIQEIGADDILEDTPSLSPMAMSVPLPIIAPEVLDEDVAQMLLAQRKVRLRRIVKAALGASMLIIAVATLRTGIESVTSARAPAAEAPPPVATAIPEVAPPTPIVAPPAASCPAHGKAPAPCVPLTKRKPR
jgi:hypothetical protein